VLFVLGEFLHYFYLVGMILTHKNDFSEKMALICWILRNVKIKLPHFDKRFQQNSKNIEGLS
jgi:hypothetical protein